MSSIATITSTPHPSFTAITLQKSSSLRSEGPSIPLNNVSDDIRPNNAELEQSENVIDVQERWNEPRINTWRVAVAFFALFNLGINDASYGALLPYMERYYDLSYIVISVVFMAPFIGYSIASFTSDLLHHHVGQRGIAILGPLSRAIAYIVLTQHPPYPATVAVLAIAGFGIGIIDAAWNAWIGDMAGANQILGLLHGFYGLGATVSPLIATALVSKYGKPWYVYYYLPLGLVLVEAGFGLCAFWREDGAAFRLRMGRGGNENGRVRAALREQVTWICSVFLFMYVGVEVALGGWIVTFMIKVRNGSPFSSGITATGFWLGLTLGRVTLGFVTGRIGERLAVSIYLLLGIALELLFWLIPSFIVSAVTVAFLGFFLGPLFPAAIVASTKLLPRHLHVSAIGFSAAIGGGGAAILPFAVGAIAQARGVKTLEPVVLALLVVLLWLWLLFPKIPKHSHDG